MKKSLSFIILALLTLNLLMNFALAEGEYAFTSSDHGNMVDYARIGDWTIRRSYQNDEFCIIGKQDGHQPLILVGDDPIGFVPCGDSFIFYGKDKAGKMRWQIVKPGGEAKPLPINYYDDVIWGDAETIWYATSGSNRQSTIYSIDHNRKNKKTVMRVVGTIIGRLKSGRLITVDFRENEVLSWEDGKSSVLYKSNVKLSNALTAGEGIWVVHTDYFGLVEDGELAFTIPGFPTSTALSDAQIVTLVSYKAGDSMCAVHVMYDDQERYIVLGHFSNYGMPRVEFFDNSINIWGPRDSASFPIDADIAYVTYEDAANMEGDSNEGH